MKKQTKSVLSSSKGELITFAGLVTSSMSCGIIGMPLGGLEAVFILPKIKCFVIRKYVERKKETDFQMIENTDLELVYL